MSGPSLVLSYSRTLAWVISDTRKALLKPDGRGRPIFAVTTVESRPSPRACRHLRPTMTTNGRAISGRSGTSRSGAWEDDHRLRLPTWTESLIDTEPVWRETEHDVFARVGRRASPMPNFARPGACASRRWSTTGIGSGRGRYRHGRSSARSSERCSTRPRDTGPPCSVRWRRSTPHADAGCASRSPSRRAAS